MEHAKIVKHPESRIADPPSAILPLDGLRGVAALMVITLHLWHFGGLETIPLMNRLGRVAGIGQSGVDLFFVLSGFLITRILLASRDQPGFFKVFYMRRVLRIFPLYYFFLVIWYFLAPVFSGDSVEPLRKTWWYWAYLQNVPMTFPDLAAAGPGHYWSLAVEEHFYLFWPLVVYLLPTRWLGWFCGALIFGALVWRYFFIYELRVSVFFFTACRMDALAFGALLAHCERQCLLPQLRRLCLPILGGLFLVLGLMWFNYSGNAPRLVVLFKHSVIATICFVLVATVVIYQDSWLVKKLLANRPIRFTGKISYGLYVYHVLCFIAVNAILPASRFPFAFIIVCLMTAYLVSWSSFRLFESPFLTMKRHFKYRENASQAASGHHICLTSAASAAKDCSL